MELIKQNKKGFQLILIVLIGMLIWMIPAPSQVDAKGWGLFSIFIATILGVVLKPLPLGAIALFSLTISVLTKTLTFSQAFSGFNDSIVWLIVSAFFIAKGFISTGLGNRIAYFFMGLFGKSTLGLGYGLLMTEFILAPAIPSVTARSGGIIFPILKSISQAFTGGEDESSKMGTFLTLCAFQGGVITSGMFLTSMAGNPLIIQLANQEGLNITWGFWALAAIVPGLCSLIAMPYIIYLICPPKTKKNPHAKEYSAKKLKEMGKLHSKEWIMLGTFFLLIGLWVVGPYIYLSATVAALIGLFVLLLTGILDWNELIKEGNVWDTLIWFATLITLASFLNQFGITKWFSDIVVSNVQGYNWITGFLIVVLIYFYSHYFFASNLAHISVMFTPFLVISIALGTPPYLAVLVLAFFSSLFGGLTHYGCGPAPIFFGGGHVKVGTWWKIGGVISIANILIWLVVGSLWWKLIGVW